MAAGDNNFIALRSLLSAATPTIPLSQNCFNFDQSIIIGNPNHSQLKRVQSADSAVDYSLPKNRDRSRNIFLPILQNGSHTAQQSSCHGNATFDDVTSSTDDKVLDQSEVTSSVFIVNKKKAAFDLWHKRKLSEIAESQPLHQNQHSEVKRVKSENYKTDLMLISDQKQRADNGSLSQLKKALAAQPVSLQKTASAAMLTTSTDQQQQDMVSPKLSRHNDAAFYPNIQCILCKEWVCSRNRYMHIESHLQYRPYKCSACNYDNRKKIFIELHIKKAHKSQGSVLYTPDTELEKKAWAMAEQCLQHTREVLTGKVPTLQNFNQPRQSLCPADSTSKPITIQSLLSSDNPPPPAMISRRNNDVIVGKPRLDDVTTLVDDVIVRPNIQNSQRRCKSLLIERSRQLGMAPDLSRVLEREEQCHLCSAYVLRTYALIEEHVRGHLSRPSYACAFEQCTVAHNSKNFVIRHMKEVHKVRRSVSDLIYTAGSGSGSAGAEGSEELQVEFINCCGECFPAYFGTRKPMQAVRRKPQPTAAASASPVDLTSACLNEEAVHGPQNNVFSPDHCFSCHIGFNLPNLLGLVKKSDQLPQKCLECSIFASSDLKQLLQLSGRVFCSKCGIFVPGQQNFVFFHALQHCNAFPFACCECPFSSHSSRSVVDHFKSVHVETAVKAPLFRWAKLDWPKVWFKTVLECFKNESVQSIGTSQTCSLCSVEITGDFVSLINHTSKHMHRHAYACLYCVEDGYSMTYSKPDEQDVLTHLKDAHEALPPVVCMDVEKAAVDERNLLMLLCFPNMWLNNNSVKQPNDNLENSVTSLI